MSVIIQSPLKDGEPKALGTIERQVEGFVRLSKLNVRGAPPATETEGVLGGLHSLERKTVHYGHCHYETERAA